ncbi:hypothetical protein BC936DRAFT_143701 [Jimgerdemannia flammicorona]|uniref:F-box domain-containing protein n=1 Tax=Jimgerdemannia flammicorona TaxID=994334 RepID=A0A432ZYL9_9FUNG|nr:hypothetical protein BC936DRAFT_143701 [Jimgerdemannia flammicorona]
MDSPDSTAIEACSSRPIRLLTTLPVDVVWDILSFLPYQECWRLVFVNRAMREHALAFLGHVLKHKFGQAGWTMTLETYLNCHHRLFGLDPNSSFEAISLHFDRRTLDLCASLDGTNQRITHVCPNCESTVSVDFTLTMRKPATKFSSKKSCVHKSDALVERPLGTGPRTPWRDMLTDGTTAKREWMPPLQKYTNVAAIELRATSGEGVRPVVGYALYNSWHESDAQIRQEQAVHPPEVEFTGGISQAEEISGCVFSA